MFNSLLQLQLVDLISVLGMAIVLTMGHVIVMTDFSAFLVTIMTVCSISSTPKKRVNDEEAEMKEKGERKKSREGSSTKTLKNLYS